MRGKKSVSNMIKQYSYGLSKNSPLVKIGNSLHLLEKEFGEKSGKRKK